MSFWLRRGIGPVLFTFSIATQLQASSERFSHRIRWEFYGDFLYMTRNELQNKSLVVEDAGVSGEVSTVINSKDLLHRFTFEPGYRVGVLYSPTEKYGFDGCFSSLTPWVATKNQVDPGSLSFPFDDPSYDLGMTDADSAQAYYKSEYWDAQINVIRFFTPRRENYFALSGLLGLRFFHLDEKFFLKMNKNSFTSPYITTTENRLIAFQAGIDFQMHPTRLLTWAFNPKVGCFANSTEQTQFLSDDSSGFPFAIRDSTAQKWQAGFYADVFGKMGLEVLKWLELHIGYQAIFMTGLALAPEQLSKKVTPHAGAQDYTSGNVVIQGIVAGMTIRI